MIYAYLMAGVLANVALALVFATVAERSRRAGLAPYVAPRPMRRLTGPSYACQDRVRR